MTGQDTSITAQGTSAVAPSSTALPDLNVGAYNFDVVQNLLNRTAWINAFLVPASKGSSTDRNASKLSGGVAEGALHRFRVELQGSQRGSGIGATNILGQPAGSFRFNWSVIPDNFRAVPGQQPARVSLDPSTSQRFVLQEASLAFGNGQDAFSSFGTGQTFPIGQGDKFNLRALAICNIMNGIGKFSGLEGILVFAGNITERGDFAGSFVLRVVDPNDLFRARGSIPPFVPFSQPDPRLFVPDTTYMIFRAQKRQDQNATFNIGPDRQIRGINVPVELRTVKVDFSAEGAAGLVSEVEFGEPIATVSSMNGVNPLDRGPTPTAISPASSQGTAIYSFHDRERDHIGTFTTAFLESRTFGLQLAGAPGLPASRFGFFGPLLMTDGSFSATQGMLLGSGAASVMPYVLSGMQMLCLEDYDGRFLAS